MFFESEVDTLTPEASLNNYFVVINSFCNIAYEYGFKFYFYILENKLNRSVVQSSHVQKQSKLFSSESNGF